MTQDAKVTRFTIDRSTWIRGQTSAASRLLRHDGKRCCLGFYLAACGVPDGALLHKGGPGQLDVPIPPWLGVSVGAGHPSRGHSKRCVDLMIENDCEGDALRREIAVARLFGEEGIDVAFVDGPSTEEGGEGGP